MLVFATFSALAFLTVLSRRAGLFHRSRADWLLDLSGLAVQGFVVPVLQVILAYEVLGSLFPAGKGVLALPGWAAFLLNFVLVDYIYYWNHRLLHHPAAWAIHRAHHTARALDVFATSRNTLWAPVAIVYLWLNGFFLYLLADPGWFLAAAAFGAALDLWRHTDFAPRAGSGLHKLLARWLITPHEHALHHGRDATEVNFGANLSLWDKLHGTYRLAARRPERFGLTDETPLRDWLWPFAGRASGQLGRAEG